MDISKLDKNFEVKKLDGKNFDFYDVNQDKFKLYGLPFYKDDGVFCRILPEDIPKVSEGVSHLCFHTSGVRFRFRSNTRAIAISAKLGRPHDMVHMPATGGSGFDVYVGCGDEAFARKAVGEYGSDTIFVMATDISDLKDEIREFTINFPLYNSVENVQIGLSENAVIEAAEEYKIKEPIVFYGSSITQGGCASRPGNAYPAILGRWLDADHVNLGFSGNARGEAVMADIIKRIDMSAFVYDYDHNAPNPEYLEETHEKFFKMIRDARPHLPIIMVSAPDWDIIREKNRIKRKNIIYNTYQNAKSKGDKNVYFVDGQTLFGNKDREACTVDGVHPNDLGFMRMAEGIYPVLKKIFE